MSIFYKGLAAKRTFIEFIKMNRLDLLHTKCFVISSFQTFLVCIAIKLTSAMPIFTHFPPKNCCKKMH